MKKAKNEIYLYLKVMLMSVVIFAIFQFHIYRGYNNSYRYVVANINNQFLIDLRSFIIVIFSGLFVSALMALILSIKEYNYQKEKVLCTFYMKSSSILREINKIKLLEFDNPYDCVLEMISDELHNYNRRDINEQLKK